MQRTELQRDAGRGRQAVRFFITQAHRTSAREVGRFTSASLSNLEASPHLISFLTYRRSLIHELTLHRIYLTSHERRYMHSIVDHLIPLYTSGYKHSPQNSSESTTKTAVPDSRLHRDKRDTLKLYPWSIRHSRRVCKE